MRLLLASLQFVHHLQESRYEEREGHALSVLPMVHRAIGDPYLLGKLLLGKIEPSAKFSDKGRDIFDVPHVGTPKPLNRLRVSIKGAMLCYIGILRKRHARRRGVNCLVTSFHIVSERSRM